MTSPLRVLTLAGAALAVATPAVAPAAAKPLELPDMAAFTVTVRGTQVTTWSLRKGDDPNDPCDSSQTGDGSQTVRFRTKPTAVRVLEGGKNLPTRDATMVPMLRAAIEVEREGEYAHGSSSPDCPAVADGDLAPLLAPDCGTRKGTGTVHLTFGHDTPANELVPLTRDVIWLSGELGPAIAYDNCPWWIGGPTEGPSETELLPDWERLVQRRLFDRRRKVIKVSGDFSQPYRAAGFTARTLTTWNVTLRRKR